MFAVFWWEVAFYLVIILCRMVQGTPTNIPDSGITHPTHNNVTSIKLFADNLLGMPFRAAIPAHVVMHDKNAVGISGQKLAEILEVYYKAGISRVEAAVLVDGQPLVVDCRIYTRHDQRRNRTYYWLYPLGTGQSLLRDMLRRHRGDAPRNAKRPLPAAILAVVPKPK